MGGTLVYSGDSIRLRRITAGFLLLFACATVVWWVIVLTSDAALALFLPQELPQLWLHGFIAADAIVYCGTAVAAAVGLWKARAWAWGCLCAHAGAAAYVALVCGTMSLLTDSAWWSVALMSPCAVSAAWFTWQLYPSRRRNT
ncbi:MAG: hypothetical protein C4547_12915 [Phycisphaerales bacterium]|nr:MAG: hypothetical protein C4547_12915 [Phycisphaerales bacterium]